MKSTTRYYLSLGSNLDRRTQLAAAVKRLRAAFQPFQLSPVYQSPAYGFKGPDFYNMAVCFDSAFSPSALKIWCREIEMVFGRTVRQSRFSNRYLDIDLVLAGNRIYTQEKLKLPRPELIKRAYVLKPMVDLAPNLSHPELQLSLESLWHKLPKAEQQSVHVVDSHDWFI